MKTFKYIPLFFFCAFSTTLSLAQGEWPDYYSGKSVAFGENVSYEVVPDVNAGQIYGYHIYNAESKWRGEDLTYKDGSKVPPNPNRYWEVGSKNPKAALYAIIEILTKEEIDFLAKEKAELSIIRIVNDQGSISDVGFSMFVGDRSLGIHPDKLYAIEQYIKKHEQYTVEGEAKELTFMISFNTIMFDRLYINLNRE